jgi:hypothetical protein
LKTPIWLFCLFCFFHSATAQTNLARRGIIDLRQHNFSESGYIPLDGEWELYMSSLIPPANFFINPQTPVDYVRFPATWDENSKSLKPGNGFATYHLRLIVKPQPFSLELPHFYSAYSIWINDKLVAKNGVVGMTRETSQPQWLPQTVDYTAASDTLDLVMHVSNFTHAKGGIRESILLGQPEELRFKRAVAVNSNITLSCSLTVLALAFVFVYLFVKQEIAALHFAALAFTWAVRSLFSNLYVITSYFPDFPWELCVKIEYTCLYLTMIWAIYFLSSLFSQDVNKLFKYLFIACNLIFILFTIFFDAWLYTQFLPVYLSFCLILLLYIIYVLIHAVVYERQGVWLIVSCIMMGVIIFAYDLSAYQGLTAFDPIIINVGYVVMFFLMAVCLSFQFGFLKRSTNRDMLTYEDLYGGAKK